jgi:hypothetical protein
MNIAYYFLLWNFSHKNMNFFKKVQLIIINKDYGHNVLAITKVLNIIEK